MAKKKRRRNTRKGTSYVAKRGLHRFLAVKGWCENQGMETTRQTSTENLFDFLIKKGMPSEYQSLTPKQAISALGENLLTRKTKSEENEANGFVYFISDSQYIKIGYTESNPDTQLDMLQTGNARVLRLIGWHDNMSITDEHNFHTRFEPYRQHDEWFRIQGSLLQYLVTEFNFRRG